MSDTDFYNRNLFRAYPFTEPFDADETVFPREAVVDMGVVFLRDAGFDPSNAGHVIRPTSAVRSGDTAVLTFTIDAAGADIDGEEIVVESSIASMWAVVPFSVVFGGYLTVFGFVVTGDLRRVAPDGASSSSRATELLSSSLPAAQTHLERRAIQLQSGHYVHHFRLVNERRTTAPAPCLSSSAAALVDYLDAPGGEPVDGDVRFMEGYNVNISVVAATNTIRISARRGAGQGEACEDVARTENEQEKLDSGESLDNAVKCNEVFSSINGVAPDLSNRFFIRGGRGISVDSPAAHTIRIAPRDTITECAT